ncbi:MAG: GNAT family N-acetyltransferase [Vallitaleaceae bacterium]|nr:GNAT family N-acetyltransferase [Vallitaleaceae bacterium]
MKESELNLVIPKKEHLRLIAEYKEEFLINGDSMDGTAGLRDYDDFSLWLRDVQKNEHKESVRKGLVTATSYLAIRKADERLIGMIQIRHELNEYLLHCGGHIGYSVRKSERRKGYAKEMLALALQECRRLNLKKVLVTCDSENIASAKTILANGGVLENVVEDEERFTERYWICIEA